MKILLENNNRLNKFCKQHKLSFEQLIELCSNHYEQYVKNTTNKIKVLPKLKHLNHHIFEFKVPFDSHKLTYFRIAYYMEKDKLIIFYATFKIIKNEFIKELTKTNLID